MARAIARYTEIIAAVSPAATYSSASEGFFDAADHPLEAAEEKMHRRFEPLFEVLALIGCQWARVMELVPRLRRVAGALSRALRRRERDLHERLGLRSERVRAEQTREVLGVRAEEIGEAVPVGAARKSGAAATDDRRWGPGWRRIDHGTRIGPLRVALGEPSLEVCRDRALDEDLPRRSSD